VKNIRMIIIFFIGFLLGYLIQKPAHENSDTYRKCELDYSSIQKRVDGGWDINSTTTAADRKVYPIVLSAIFDVTCSANPEIDERLALYFLQNGGRVSINDLISIRDAAERSNHTKLSKYISNIFGL